MRWKHSAPEKHEATIELLDATEENFVMNSVNILQVYHIIYEFDISFDI